MGEGLRPMIWGGGLLIISSLALPMPSPGEGASVVAAGGISFWEISTDNQQREHSEETV